MKRIYILIMSSILLASAAFSAEKGSLKPAIVLNHIKSLQSGEKGGDELYFDITVMRTDKPKEFFRIPKKPIHWPSNLTDNIKKVKLWSEPLKKGHSVILLLALMDEDTTVVNPDDMIGVIRVELKNNDGNLESQWTIPNRAAGPVTVVGQKGDIQKFDLFGPYGQYEVYLSLKK